MSIRRRWVAQCDKPGCTATEVLTGDQYDGKWELGILITDRGWEAAPGRKECYCPKHNGPGGRAVKTITTIEITDEMVEQMKDALAELFNQRLGPEDAPYIPSDFNGLAEDELTAVLPIIEQAVIDELGLVEEIEYHTGRHRYVTSWVAD